MSIDSRLLTKTTTITIVNSNKKRYRELGYTCEIGDTLEVAYEHAPSSAKIQYSCNNCGVECTVKKYVYKKLKHKACKSCAQHLGNKHLIHDLVGQVFGRLTVVNLHRRVIGRETYWETKCRCGNKHITTARSLKSGNVSSCGCYSVEVHRNRMLSDQNPMRGKKGELHPNWNPNLPEKIRNLQRKDLHKVQKIREKVFKRDNFTCVVCNSKGGSLQAHHICSWKYYPELRYDQTNITTVCITCHNRYHSQTPIKQVNQKTFNTFRDAYTQS